MSRGLNSTFLSKINSGYLKPALFVKAGFSTEMRFWSGVGSCNLASQSYVGAGDLLDITPVVENSDLGTSGLSISLSGCNNTIVNAIGNDVRIGHSHTRVPGYDGKRGYAGACFPKDTAAFSQYAKTFSILDKVIEVNNEYRANYDKDAREIEQKVEYE